MILELNHNLIPFHIMDRSTKKRKSASRITGQVKRVDKKKVIAPEVRSYINSRLARVGETKYWYDYGANNTITTASGGYPTNRNLAPVLAQGTSPYQRIGNKIKVIRAVTRGYVNILPYNVTSNPLSTPVLIKLYAISAKQLNTTNIATSDINVSFFDVTGGSTGFQGNPLDMTFFTNPEKWHVWATRQFEIGATYASSTGPPSTGGYFDNSNMSKSFEIDYSDAFKRVVTYDDNNTSPSNVNVFLVFQAIYADGQASGTYQMAEYHITSRVEFKDV